MRVLGPYSLVAARRTTGAALVMLWVIIVSGATVRLTGSGLGCPDWPTCTDARAVPALEQHALIEFANRMVATPTLLATLAAAWVAWRLRGAPRRDLRVTTTIALVGVLAQAAIGAAAVLLELPPAVVSAHFLVSVAILLVATWAWAAARSATPLRVTVRDGGPPAVAAVVMLASLLAVIIAGVVTTASGPHSGARSAGIVVDRFDAFGLAVALHARGAMVFLVLVLALTLWRRRTGGGARDLALLLALVAVQVMLGEWQFRTGLPWGIVLAHVANAGIVWIVACHIAIASITRRPAPPSVPGDPRPPASVPGRVGSRQNNEVPHAAPAHASPVA